jgi:TolB-like protein/Flp pilus assembly protein TadD
MLKKIGLAKSDATVPLIEPSPSIAVLPFVNMSADPEQEYFCDGLSEELINALTQIKDLKVIARTSAFSFRGKEVDVREIGEKLDVSNVLEGSVRKAGNRLRITAQLVNTESGHHIWSEKYDRDLDDIFAVQDEITDAIVEKLEPTLLGKEGEKLARRQTVALEAYNLYLQGRYFWNQRTDEGLKRAVDYFKQAIAKEPSYALAYVGIADSHILSSFYTPLPPKKVYPKAKQAVLKALEFDEALCEAHATLAFIMTAYDWDRNGAEREFRRAIELNPGHANTRHWYSMHLSNMGRSDEAIREIRHALELDPLSVVFRRSLGITLAHARRYEQAIDAYKQAIEFDPDLQCTHSNLGICYLYKSMYNEALEEFEKEKLTSQDWHGTVKANIGITYAIVGREDEARQLLKDLMDRAKETRVSCVSLAILCFALKEIDKGFEVLERGYAERDFGFGLGWFKVDPLFDSVRSDPRFKALLKKIGLAD